MTCCMRDRRQSVRINGSNRWKMADSRGPHRSVVIDTAWLERVINKLSAAEVALNNIRPIHKNAAFANRSPRPRSR